MATSGFEGFEKRLELHFSGDDPMMMIDSIGLRRLDFESLQGILDEVQCTVVSAVGNRYFDAYVLSESSLFVYPSKIIIKTCGTTQLLKSIPPLLAHATQLMGYHVCRCRYTRGSFIFPKAQPFPHTSFRDEVMYLEETLPSHLSFRKACVMPPPVSNKKKNKSTTTHSWHVYTASDQIMSPSNLFTIEVCMTELDQVLARKFFRRLSDKYSGDISGREMTEATGINDINPNALICDFGFDPCGYSMNGVHGVHYSTIHVTPEDGYSYASFECDGFFDDSDDHGVDEMLNKVVQIFRPATMSVAITCARGDLTTRVKNSVEKLGMIRRGCKIEEFPGAGTIAFQKFTTRRK